MENFKSNGIRSQSGHTQTSTFKNKLYRGLGHSPQKPKDWKEALAQLYPVLLLARHIQNLDHVSIPKKGGGQKKQLPTAMDNAQPHFNFVETCSTTSTYQLTTTSKTTMLSTVQKVRTDCTRIAPRLQIQPLLCTPHPTLTVYYPIPNYTAILRRGTAL